MTVLALPEVHIGCFHLSEFGHCRPVFGVTRPITRLRALHLLKVMPLHETVMLLGWMVVARKLVEDWGGRDSGET